VNGYSWLFVLGVVLLALFLPVYSYLALIYRELGRMTTGPVHEHLDIFEAEIEPRIKLQRRSAGRAFRILGHFWLAFLVLETTRGVWTFVSGTWESVVQLAVFIGLEVVIAMHFIPDILLYRTTGRWLVPLLPLIRARRRRKAKSSAPKRALRRWWKPRKKKESSSRSKPI